MRDMGGQKGPEKRVWGLAAGREAASLLSGPCAPHPQHGPGEDGWGGPGPPCGQDRANPTPPGSQVTNESPDTGQDTR